MGYYRFPKTLNERKQFYATLDQDMKFYIKVRGRRRPLSLWFAWDDIDRSDYRIRNWKQHRKTQWK